MSAAKVVKMKFLKDGTTCTVENLIALMLEEGYVINNNILNNIRRGGNKRAEREAFRKGLLQPEYFPGQKEYLRLHSEIDSLEATLYALTDDSDGDIFGTMNIAIGMTDEERAEAAATEKKVANKVSEIRAELEAKKAELSGNSWYKQNIARFGYDRR